MSIDIAHLVGGKPVIVLDAKYKVADSSGNYPNADHYQMLAYCTALGLDSAWLVYAQGSRGLVERHIRNTDTKVVEYPLDLGAPRDLLTQVAELGRHAWTLRALSSAESQSESAN